MKLRRIITMFLVLVLTCLTFTACIDLNLNKDKENAEKGMTENEALELVKQKTFEEELSATHLNDEYKVFSVGEMANIWDVSYDWAEGLKYEGMYKSKWVFNKEIPYYDVLKSALGESFNADKNHYACLRLTAKNLDTDEYEDFSFFVFAVDKETKDVSAVAYITPEGSVEETDEESVVYSCYSHIYSIDVASEYDYERIMG